MVLKWRQCHYDGLMQVSIFSMAGFVKKRIHQFCQKTSVKGIPRILRTKSYFMRTIWTISVTCFLAIAIYLSFLLLSDYLEYRSVTSLREYNIDVSGSTSDSVRLPDITLCNMNPFSISTYNMTDVLSLEHYHKKVLSMTICDNCTAEETKKMEELRSELLTTSGYYIEIKSENARRVSHKKEGFIASCHISILSGMHPRRLPCEGIVEIHDYSDYMYYNCFTLKVSQPTSRDLYHGMILVLQLNNHRDIIEQQQFLTPHIIPGQTSGAVMLLHQQDQLPMMTRNNIHLPSGFFTSLRLRYLRKIRLPKPYGTCKNTAKMEGNYQQAMCFSICVQTLILRTCGCVDFTNYNDFFGLVASMGMSPCLSLKTNTEMLHQYWNCVQEMRLNATIQCKDTCPIPCEEMTYEYDVSSLTCSLGVRYPLQFKQHIRNRKDHAHGFMKWKYHDDVIKWKHFPRFWPFVRGIHQSPVDSPNKGQWQKAFIFSLICTWTKG